MSKYCRYLVLPVIVALLGLGLGVRHAAADQRDFKLINGTNDVTITELYVAASSSDDWEEDVLGSDVLLPGESVNVHFGRFNPSTCTYDIKVIGKDGSTGELDEVDLCSTSTVTFTD